MEEIEFRAWCVTEKYWDDQILNTRPLNKIIQCNTHIITQYTGLKDKNGIKIFEGDIVNWANTIYEVRYGIVQDREFKYYMYPTFYLHRDVYGAETRFDTVMLEMKGNIYENPELLTN